MCVSVSVSIPSPRLLITNSFIWCDMGPYDKQVLQPLYGSCRVVMAFKVEWCHRNQPNKTGLMLYKALLSL